MIQSIDTNFYYLISIIFVNIAKHKKKYTNNQIKPAEIRLHFLWSVDNTYCNNANVIIIKTTIILLLLLLLLLLL